jgi:hypothetical protein
MVKTLVCHTAAGDNVTTMQKLAEFQALDYRLVRLIVVVDCCFGCC